MSELSASMNNCSGSSFDEGEDSSKEVIITDGWSKFRDGKKWKLRWCVLTKLSPAADCLQLQVYRDKKERARNGHTKASLSLQHILALESGFTLDNESHTLSIICQDLNVVLAFDNRERLMQWSVRIANNVGEGHQFLVQLASAPTKSKLTPGPVKLHVGDRKFCLTGGLPPRLLGAWEVSHLRRYGIVEGRLVFEGGSKCGKGEGVHVLVPEPPQIHLIVDALEVSAKGQLSRMPSRRFGTDSPGKSPSEMRNMSRLAESTTNVSMGSVPGAKQQIRSLSLIRNMSPPPKESRSAEQLCNSGATWNSMDRSANVLSHTQNNLWTSSDSSSRCDLESVDNVLVQSGGDLVDAKSSGALSTPVQKHPTSKTFTPAMERCLSCMSKLGDEAGQDALSPSWTMDLNCVASTMSASISQSQVVPKSGSVGSTNSDRLSNSSRGSRDGATEFYYDTPRSVLLSEMHRSCGQSNTPAANPHNEASSSALSLNTIGNSASQGDQYSGRSGGNGAISASSHFHSHSASSCSPQRHSLSHGSGCGFNGCHCHTHAQPGGNCPTSRVQAGVQQQQGPIYSNTNDNRGSCEVNFQLGKSCTTDFHPVVHEIYDVPRCASQHQHNANCCTNSNGSTSLSGPSSGNNIDWSKKQPMDRSSVASSSTVGSDQASEYYDTPRSVKEGLSSGSRCASTSSVSDGIRSQSGTVHSVGCEPQQNYARSMTSNPCHFSHRTVVDPLENYDVPPCSLPLSPHTQQHTHSNRLQLQPSSDNSNVNMRVNGEGKMPLVTGKLSSLKSANIPIYAQVDKSKKVQRMNSAMQHIYQNAHDVYPQQPNYMNIEQGRSPKTVSPLVDHSSCAKRLHGIPGVTEDKAPGSNNYVNMDFSNSLCLYENCEEKSKCSPLAMVGSAAKSKPSAISAGPNNLTKETEIEKRVSTAEIDRWGENINQRPNQKVLLPPAAAFDETFNKGLRPDNDDTASLPLRRSSSVPCKGGHANRGSASSCDSGVSGDGGLCFENYPLGDFGSLCLHESLPRKNQRSSPNSIGGNVTAVTSTPKPQDSTEVGDDTNSSSGFPVYSTLNAKVAGPSPPDGVNNNESLTARHYETIDEIDSSKTAIPMLTSANGPREAHQLQRQKNHSLTVLSDPHSTSGGVADRLDNIDTLSASFRGSSDTLNNHINPALASQKTKCRVDILGSPKCASSMKPRSGKEYFKIDRRSFTKTD